jgi:hypothetical protein
MGQTRPVLLKEKLSRTATNLQKVGQTDVFFVVTRLTLVVE